MSNQKNKNMDTTLIIITAVVVIVCYLIVRYWDNIREQLEIVASYLGGILFYSLFALMSWGIGELLHWLLDWNIIVCSAISFVILIIYGREN